MVKDIIIHTYVDGEFREDIGCQINLPAKIDHEDQYKHWLPCSVAVRQWIADNNPSLDVDQIYYKGRMMNLGAIVAEVETREYAKKRNQQVLNHFAENPLEN